MKVYSGRRDKKGLCVVHVIASDGDSRLLPQCLDVVNHSPTGFEWGYGGSGPAQLAFALLYDVFQDENVVRRIYQEFKRAHIATLPRSGSWRMTEQDILRHAAALADNMERRRKAQQ